MIANGALYFPTGEIDFAAPFSRAPSLSAACSALQLLCAPPAPKEPSGSN
jgi:hypothetical protein